MHGVALMAVTGAFGFSGRHIAARLLAAGHEVVNLTNHPGRTDPFDGRTRVRPLAFDDDRLAADLAGVDTLFNTYWVRFARGSTDHRLAVANSRLLLAAAGRAKVRRVVHVSIANLEERPSDPYYAGKGEVEQALRAAGPSWAILRPAVLFGDEPILVNSIAWLLRHLPVFMIPGDGEYGIQPAHVEDLADLAVAAAASDENAVRDVAGPERFSFDEFVRLIRDETGSRSLVVHAPARIALLAAQLVSPFLGDVLITPQEMRGLTANVLVSHQPALGRRPFSAWLHESAPWLGRQYLSEVGRHFATGAPRA
ncbi:MAG TPA: NAD(P)H-binding protein [Candidatus Limnocylindria bacterium]|nr:NAD(P)H-binding protein [Candidatus Limnocylindria bacterium]